MTPPTNNLSETLELLAETIRQQLDAETATREQALVRARSLIKECSLAIRAVHRQDLEKMNKHLATAGELARALREELASYPSLYYSGYAQDAIKEYVEARATCALILGEALPTPDELQVEAATYLRGLAETVGELRRRILDILRQGYSEEADRLLGHMEDIYAILVTMDYPDAITYGLRRLTDIARSIIERTESDLTFNLQSQRLHQALSRLQTDLEDFNGGASL